MAQYVEGKPYVRVLEILINAIEKPSAQHTPKDREEVRRALLALGWAKGPNKKINGASVKFYYPPSTATAKPEDNKPDVDTKPEEAVTTSKTYVDRKAQQDTRVVARRTTDQNIDSQFDGYSAGSEKTNRPPIRAPEPAAPREPVQGSATAIPDSQLAAQPGPLRATPDVTKSVPMVAATNMAFAVSMIDKGRKPMIEDNDNDSSTEGELMVPAIDDVREYARRGSEMLEVALAQLKEALAAGVRFPRGSRATSTPPG